MKYCILWCCCLLSIGLYGQGPTSIDASYQLAARYMKTQPDSSWHYLNLCLDQCHAAGNPEKAFTARLIQLVLLGDEERYVEHDSIVELMEGMRGEVRDELQVFFLRAVGSARQKRGEVDTARDYYIRAFHALDTSFKDYEKLRSVILHNIGLACKELGDYETAIDHYLQALAIDPQAPKLLNDLGNLFKNIRDYDVAKQYYRLCIDSRDDNYKAINLCQKSMQNAHEAIGERDSSRIILEHLLRIPDSCSRSVNFSVRDDLAAHLILEAPEAPRIDSLLAAAEAYIGKSRARANDVLMTRADLAMARGQWRQADQLYGDIIEGQVRPFDEEAVVQRYDVMRAATKVRTMLGLEIPPTWIDQLHNLAEARYDDRLSAALISTERKYQALAKEQRITQLEADHQRSQHLIKTQRLWLAIILVSSLLLGALAYIFWLRRRQTALELSVAETKRQQVTAKLKQTESRHRHVKEENRLLKHEKRTYQERLAQVSDSEETLLAKRYTIGFGDTSYASVPVGDILYVTTKDAEKNWCHYVVRKDGGHITYKSKDTLQGIMSKDTWPASIFCITHQSYIVNIHHVDPTGLGSGRSMIRMSNGDEVPLSRRNRKAFLEKVTVLL